MLQTVNPRELTARELAAYIRWTMYGATFNGPAPPYAEPVASLDAWYRRDDIDRLEDEYYAR